MDLLVRVRLSAFVYLHLKSHVSSQMFFGSFYGLSGAVKLSGSLTFKLGDFGE